MGNACPHELVPGLEPGGLVEHCADGVALVPALGRFGGARHWCRACGGKQLIEMHKLTSGDLPEQSLGQGARRLREERLCRREPFRE